MNPYKTPTSPLGNSPENPENSPWWRVFFWVTVLLTVLTILGLMSAENLGLFDYVDFIISLIAVLGLYGYAHYKPLGGVVFWRYFFYTALVETLVFSGLFPLLGIPRYGDVDVGYWHLFDIGYALIILRALYRYAYRSAFVWKLP